MNKFQEAIKPLDQYFGMYSTATMLIIIVGWYNGAASWMSAVLIGVYVVFNLVISQISLRSKNALRIENFRYFVALFILAPLCLIYIKTSPLQHWWQGYLIYGLCGSVTYQALTGKKRVGLMLIPLFLLSFIIATAVGIENPNWYSTLIDSATIIMNSFLMIKMLGLISTNLEKEKERSTELAEALKQLRALQEQIVHSEKFAALGEMAGGVAHEINTPLAIIITLIGQLKDVLAEDHLDRKMAIQSSEKIEETAFRIANIVSGMRTFSRDSSQDPMTQTSVKSIVVDTLSLCQEKFLNSGIKISIDQIPDDVSVSCRPGQIAQVLLNLLNNSYHALEKSSEKWIKISAQTSGEHTEIRVTDSGSGIPSAIHEKIFQPFFTTKDVGQGTGMGLSISLGVIKNHGGALSLNKDSANTQFVIGLPKQ